MGLTFYIYLNMSPVETNVTGRSLPTMGLSHSTAQRIPAAKVLIDGITNYIADLKSADGIARVRIMCSMNMPHWRTPEMARQV